MTQDIVKRYIEEKAVKHKLIYNEFPVSDHLRVSFYKLLNAKDALGYPYKYYVDLQKYGYFNGHLDNRVWATIESVPFSTKFFARRYYNKLSKLYEPDAVHVVFKY